MKNVKPNSFFKIRVTGDVLDTANATRQVKVEGEVLTFGREPVYLQAEKLPQKLTMDAHLQIEPVTAVPEGTPILYLKSERVGEG